MDVLPGKEVNNRQRKRRLRLDSWEGDSGQPDIFGEMVCVERGRQAQGKSKVKEAKE